MANNPSDTESGKPTQSGCVPAIKCKAVDALKSWIPKKRQNKKQADINQNPGTDINEAPTSTGSDPEQDILTPNPNSSNKNASCQPTVIEVSDDEDKDKEDEEDVEAQLKCLQQEWNAPIYAFFYPVPSIGHGDEGRQYHEFKCFAKGCGKTVRRYLDKKDAGSTSNMHKHARLCWGVETVKAASDTKNATEA
ncbi:hypothetical protein BDZ97DRAFT_1921434 [Flammula alnicola]|nr:hypothetical protein BDZ97DRAFT_1921434 [Flammula alnicola]